MITIRNEFVMRMISHARGQLPDEACGILSGKEGVVSDVYPMTNADKSSQTYFMDPKEQLRVMKKIRERGQELIGIYHSHPETEAVPSKHDVALAYYPDASYIIVSFKDKEKPRMRSFRIVDKEVKEEEIKT